MTAALLDLDRVAVGDRLPPLRPGRITRATLALFGPASGDYHPIHLDIDVARSAGVPDVFAHGMLSMAYLGRLLTGWVDQGRIRSLGARFTAVTPVHAEPVCTGVVTGIRTDGAERIVTVELTVALGDGTRTLAGRAEIAIRATHPPAAIRPGSPQTPQ